MKKFYFLTTLLIFTSLISFAQTEQCGVNEFIEAIKNRNPELYKKIQLNEMEFEAKVKLSSKEHSTEQTSFEPKNLNQRNGGLSSVQSLCGYNNSYIGSGAAPNVLGSTLTTTSIYGGDYITVTNMIAGRTYRVSTCGNNDFDTQITIYTAGGGSAVGYNDDLCANNQSEIYFTPFVSGNYDILLNEYDCQSTFLVSTTLVVELDYTPDPIITIPVVVHVVWNTSTENISDAQIFSQINVLNQDFRRLNPDISFAPTAFKGFSADTRYQFCLAQQDPYGFATNGITRTFTNKTQFDISNGDTSIWLTNSGGQDSWDRTKYLNIWVCDFPANYPTWGGMIGIGLLPWLGIAFPQMDGIVVDYQAFGTIGTASPPVNLGRNTTHEVGHYLGLRHIWGDEDACIGSDSCVDTPNQTMSSSGTPTFPLTDACSPNFPGVMFNNYMDYSDDVSKNMFTFFQFVRTDAAIRNGGIRASLATSPGCTPSTSEIIENSSGNLISLYPNPSTGNFTLDVAEKIHLSRSQNSIKIFDIYGREVFTTPILESKISIQLNETISSGIYFIEVVNEKGFILGKEKIIVQ